MIFQEDEKQNRPFRTPAGCMERVGRLQNALDREDFFVVEASASSGIVAAGTEARLEKVETHTLYSRSRMRTKWCRAAFDGIQHRVR